MIKLKNSLRCILWTVISVILSYSIFVSAEETDIQKDPNSLDRIVAVVNHDAIPESELNRQLQLLLVRLRQSDMTLPPLSQLRKQVLDKMILEKLQLQMAKESKLEIEENTLKQAIDDIAGRDGLSVTQMKKFLEEQGISFAQFNDSIKNEILLSKLQHREVGQSITISNQDVEQFLKSPAGLDQSGVEYRMGHILISLPETASSEKIVAAEKRAKELVNQLNKGADFSQIAMAKSAGPQALNGGDLGFRKVQELPTLFAKLAPTLGAGQVLGPIRNESGFHIIKLLEKRLENSNTTNVSPQDLRTKAQEVIYQRRFEEKLATWLRRIRDEAEVQIYLNET